MNRSHASGETASRPSSSSFQNFFGRLQNRPPQYETEQEWNARRTAAAEAETAGALQSGTSPPPPITTNTSQPPTTHQMSLPLAPPAYDGIISGNDNQNIAPPPYSMAIIQIDENGILNTGYVMDNPNPTESLNNSNNLGDSNGPQRSKNDCDTIIDDKGDNFKSMHM